jgi:hypothetical protein
MVRAARGAIMVCGVCQRVVNVGECDEGTYAAIDYATASCKAGLGAGGGFGGLGHAIGAFGPGESAAHYGG